MTTLHSLEIQGIRSFPPNNVQTIRFEKPLTLIVGQNGAGKTTIVECLKTVTSGIMPPNCDRGKSFLHDSKLTENGDVRAQIKLTVETFSKDVVSATRKYSIVRDRNTTNKVTFKSGDSVLHIKPFIGEETTVSLKASDMDNSMPLLMGLSKALIDSVVFCHQDENNWVLDDLAKVKARFDDLLETSRYTKALGALSKAKKEQDDAIKLCTTQLQAAKAQMMQMADLRNQVTSNTEEISKTKTNIGAMENQMIRLSETIKTLSSELETVSVMSDAIRDLKTTIMRLTDEAKTLHATMNEIYEEGLDDLQHFHAALSTELENEQMKVKDLSLKIYQLVDTINELHQKIDHSKDKMNNRMVLKETMKSTKETLESVKIDIMKTMEAKGTEFNEATVTAYMEQLMHITENEGATHRALSECKTKIQELEETTLQLNAQRNAKEFFLQNLCSEIDNTNTHIEIIGDMEETRQQLEIKKQDQLHKLEEDQHQLQSLLHEKRKLSMLMLRAKNSIEGNEIENSHELSIAIKFLESIINNDRQFIVAYIKEVIGDEIDGADYVTAIRSFFQKCILSDGNVKEGMITSVMSNAEKFQQDCVTAIIQMTQNNDLTSELPVTIPLCSDGISKNESSKAPYNVLLKIVTNTRIAEYIEYFKSLLHHEIRGSACCKISYDEIMGKLEVLNTTITTMEGTIKEGTKNLEILGAEAMQLTAKGEQLDEMRSKIMQMELKKAQYTAEMKHIENSLDQAASQLQVKRKEYEELNEKIASANKCNVLKAATMSSLIERYKENITKLRMTEQALEETNDEGGNNENLQMQITKLNESIKESRTEELDLMQSINNHTMLLDNLQQNITLKLTQQKLSEAQQKLETLQDQLGSANEQELTTKLREANEMCAETGLSIATLKGTLMAREENIAKLQQMLESDNYRYAQKNYVDTLVKLKTHAMTKEDLDLYSKTLEMGLHRFHSEKISQINTVLKRIWREVYTGCHIDYIEIQSSVDNTVPSTAQAPKSYNYRMVMVTHNGTEMDMRGHCSAGERVLASLIVRITLMETFCSNCNVLILDEPTTNLDRDNIVSLEASLAKLVNECSLDFQLVIITHDDSFARKIAQRCNCDKYYNIVKNERGGSVINAVPLGSGFMA